MLNRIKTAIRNFFHVPTYTEKLKAYFEQKEKEEFMKDVQAIVSEYKAD